MVSHFLEGGDNTWDLIRYNVSSNGKITLERKSPHYICEFESFTITGQKTETLKLKLKADLKVKVNSKLLTIVIIQVSGLVGLPFQGSKAA